MKKRSAIIFDIDGTLWDATGSSAEGWNIGLEKLGSDVRVSGSDIASVAGKPYVECVEILLSGVDSERQPLLRALNNSEIAYIRKHGGSLYRGLYEGVKKLAKEYRIFLVSNCQAWYLEQFLEHSKLQEFLEGYDCHGLSGVSKSKMLLNMKEKYALQDSVYVGDTLGDQTAAEDAKIPFVCAAYGFGDCAGFQDFDSFEELVEYFLQNV